VDLERHVAARLAHAAPEGALCVGLSGGLDSVVLLDLIARHARDSCRPVSAVHVHHGLSPNADAWADFCRELCAERDIPLDVQKVRVDRSTGDGIEAAARVARYDVYATRKEPHVVLAHHLEDQSETVLLQILRGTGLKGAAAMPEVRRLAGSEVLLVRPLLGVARSALRAHAQAASLRWIEDESNASLRQDRNYLRHEIAPRLDERLPRWREAAARFARNAAAADALLLALARIDGLPEARGEELRADVDLPPARRANLLRAFLSLNDVAMPDEARLAQMTQQLFAARGDARVLVEHEGLALLRFRDRIHLEEIARTPEGWQVEWRGQPEVQLSDGIGSVRFHRVTGDGIAAARAVGTGWRFAPRAGGERLRLDPRRPTRTLKNLLRENDVPPWERERLPLLFHGERLVWVPGVGIESDYACPPGAPGLRPEWLQNSAATSQETPDVLK
jgi:tRNA(Ile)-lysidine synthase